MSLLSPIGEIAKLARLGDVAAINDVLDGMHGKEYEVQRGRAAADRLLRRDPPLPPVDQNELAKVEGWHCYLAPTPEPPRPTVFKKPKRKRAA